MCVASISVTTALMYPGVDRSDRDGPCGVKPPVAGSTRKALRPCSPPPGNPPHTMYMNFFEG
jgi:hypothetical protein